MPEDSPATRFTRSDVTLASLVGVIAAALSLHASGRFDPSLYELVRGNGNRWFEADHTAVFHAVTNAGSVAQRLTGRHPLFVILTFPVMSALTATGLEPVVAVRWMLAAWAALASGLLCLALRGLGLPRAVSALFSGVFLAGATFTHWFVVLDTHPLAAVSMSLMLLVLTSAGTHPWWPWIVGSAATLSITTTNWSLALIAALTRLSLRSAVLTSGSALAIVVLLAVAQELRFPNSVVFFGPTALQAQGRFVRFEAQQLLTSRDMAQPPTTRRVAAARLRGLVLTSAVAPPPEVLTRANPRRARLLVVNQYSPSAAHTVSGWIALASWLVLLVAGVVGGCANVERRRVFATICLFLLGQTALHLLIGEMTFLYAANVAGALVVLTAFGWFSPLRIPAVVAALLFVVFGSLSNHAQFEAAIRLLNGLGPAG